jgi:hypothetical protein
MLASKTMADPGERLFVRLLQWMAHWVLRTRRWFFWPQVAMARGVRGLHGDAPEVLDVPQRPRQRQASLPPHLSGVQEGVFGRGRHRGVGGERESGEEPPVHRTSGRPACRRNRHRSPGSSPMCFIGATCRCWGRKRCCSWTRARWANCGPVCGSIGPFWSGWWARRIWDRCSR